MSMLESRDGSVDGSYHDGHHYYMEEEAESMNGDGMEMPPQARLNYTH